MDLTNSIAFKGRTPSVLSSQVSEKKSERMSSLGNFNYQLISLTHQTGGMCLTSLLQIVPLSLGCLGVAVIITIMMMTNQGFLL